jgi:hypothetical protein
MIIKVHLASSVVSLGDGQGEFSGVVVVFMGNGITTRNSKAQ